jgi:lysophospholipase L1-like esterase
MSRTRALLGAYCAWWVVALICLAGCERASSGRFVASDARIAYLGAVDRKKDTTTLAWPMAAMRIRFEGKSLSLLLDDTPLHPILGERDVLAVELDGVPRAPLHLRSGRHVYPVVQGLPDAVHELTLTKRTEAEVGVVSVVGLRLPEGGRLLRARRPARTVVFVGDSISAGYGILGADASCRAHAGNADATRAYPALLARTLGMEAFLLAWSGKGVWRNHDGSRVDTLPAVLDRALPTASDSSALEWPGRESIAAVVVNLGTNDFVVSMPDEAAFLEAYRAFITRLRARAPRAPLYLVLGPLIVDEGDASPQRSVLRRLLQRLKDELHAPAQPVELVEVWAKRDEGSSCAAHPSQRTQARIAKELEAHLRKGLRL